ncbi:MAG: Crp/Fnr family transcriptional regulator [Deltaproteobacteria bacterium]|nr:Crp/Fnr family transcriptional regulator [Deltaproteobacteria bacterium]
MEITTLASLHVTCHPLLATLGDRQLQAVRAHGRLVTFRERRSISKPGSEPKCGLLLQGTLRTYRRGPSGAELTVSHLQAPAVFGASDALCGPDLAGGIGTVTASTVVLLPLGLFAQLVKTQPAFAQGVLQELAEGAAAAAEQQAALAFESVDTRLVGLLMTYVRVCGTPERDGVRLDLHLSQESLARDLGVSRKSLTRSLKKLKAEELLLKRAGHYVIRNVAALAAHTPVPSTPPATWSSSDRPAPLRPVAMVVPEPAVYAQAS